MRFDLIRDCARSRPCRHKACPAENRRCGLCLFNPKKRCSPGCNIAGKQLEKHCLEAPCLAKIKVALHTAEALEAEASAGIWSCSSANTDVSDVVIEVIRAPYPLCKALAKEQKHKQLHA